ncbi:MAG: T9SS type A sorting domain-containing protein [Bacteroidota bacterium]
MTPGLDPGYDAGLFSTGGEIELFTRLVNDNGVRFMIQAVPDYDFEQNAVPVGVNFAKGGEVTFSGFVVPLDGNYKIYLEDRLTGVLTDLSQDEYTVTLAANTKGTGRFFIVAAQTTGIETPGEISDNLMVWASDRKIHIRGELSGKATARLLDLNGRLIMETSLPDTRNNLVQAPVRTGGIYLLQVLDGNRQTTRKVVIN